MSFKNMKAAELRSIVTDLTAKASAKITELVDGLPADDVRRIEGEHDAIVRQIDEAKAALVDAEIAERAAAPSAAPAPAVDASRIADEAIAAERKRIAYIREKAGKLNLREDFVARHIDGGSDERAFNSAVVDYLASNPAANVGPTGTASVEVTRDESDTRRASMVAALEARLARAGGDRNANIPDHARAYGEMGLVEMAAECIGHRGSLRTTRAVNEVLDEAFKRSGYGTHSTSDFPSIMLDAMNKRLLARYDVAAPAYRRFAAPYMAGDFRFQNVIRAGDFPALQAVNESGEIKNGTFSESRERIKVDPYGVSFNITRVMIINDNLSAIDQVLGSAGVRVADWEDAQAFASLLSASGAGPTLLTDNTAVFHANHGNLAASGSAITVASIGVGRAAMMKQKTLDGIVANFSPVTLLTGPDKATEAEQLLTSITPATQAAAIPDSIRRLTTVSDANIPGNAWFLFADPTVAPTWLYAYLDGYEGPRLSSEEQFNVQGLRVKLEHDFGVAAIDYRGAYRNPGA